MIVDAKMLAVMDSGTRIPLIAFKVSPNTMKECVMLERHGFGINPHKYTFFYDIFAGNCRYDPYKLGDSYTLTPACNYIREHWGEISSGDLVDAEFIRGETSEPRNWESEYLCL